MKKGVVFLACFIAVLALISPICRADETISGVAKSFDNKSGRLALQTTAQTETVVYIPQTVKVYLMVKVREVAKDWWFLRDNLMKGTKVKVLKSGGSVVTIWFVEIPR